MIQGLSEPTMRFARDVMGLDLYEILGVAPEAAPREIRAAYRRKVRESHPDLHPDNPRLATHMRDLNLAARVLLEPSARAAYDRSRVSSRRDSPRSWWERQGSQGPYDWVAPPVPPPREAVPHGFLRGLRGSVASALSTFDAYLLGLPPRGRLLLGSLGVGLALMLLVAAQPRLGAFFGDARARPVSISPALLTP